MNDGLAKQGGSTIMMLPTYVLQLPTGYVEAVYWKLVSNRVCIMSVLFAAFSNRLFSSG